MDVKMKILDQLVNDKCALYNGDCVEVMGMLPADSVGYSIFSPPYSNLYAYSNSERDIGNCRSDAEFFAHFDYVIDGLMRVVPVEVDYCRKSRDGTSDSCFRGRALSSARIHLSRACHLKDPLIGRLARGHRLVPALQNRIISQAAAASADLPQAWREQGSGSA